MSYDTNPANDYATGDGDGPSREEVARAIDQFNENNTLDAWLGWNPYGEWYIQVQDEDVALYAFDTLDEFEDFAINRANNIPATQTEQELAA